MRRIQALTCAALVVTLPIASIEACAQGQPREGLALAQKICSECHAITRAQPVSPNGAAPRFQTIANVPGMTGTALSVALQSPHRAMPNVMLEADQLSDIVAYILKFNGMPPGDQPLMPDPDALEKILIIAR